MLTKPRFPEENDMLETVSQHIRNRMPRERKCWGSPGSLKRSTYGTIKPGHSKFDALGADVLRKAAFHREKDVLGKSWVLEF